MNSNDDLRSWQKPLSEDVKQLLAEKFERMRLRFLADERWRAQVEAANARARRRRGW